MKRFFFILALLLLVVPLASADRIFFDDTTGLGEYGLYNLTYVNSSTICVGDPLWCFDSGSDINASVGGSGDITAVIAGIGLTGGATTGGATLNINTTYLNNSVEAYGYITDANDNVSGSELETLFDTTIGLMYRSGSESYRTVGIGNPFQVSAGIFQLISGSIEATDLNLTDITLNDFTDDLGNRGYTHLSNFTDDLTDQDTNLSESDVIGFINTTDTYSLSITGNADTATALASNGANCAAGNYPLGVDESGAVEGCTADSDTTYSDLSEFADSGNIYQDDIGSDCSAGNFVKGIDNDGTLDCDAPAGSGDVTAVYTNGDYLTGGAASGDISLLLDETVLNATIDARDSDTTYTAGDALTLTGTDFDFDGGATPGGELGGTWANPTIDSGVFDDEYIELGDNFAGDVTGTYGATVVGDDSHAHTSSTISGLDISSDTNLASGNGVTLNGDSLDFDCSDVTDSGTDYISCSSQDLVVDATGVLASSNNIDSSGNIEWEDANDLNSNGDVIDDSHNHIYSNIDATTSSNWAGRVTDETGSGAWVFATSPTLVTPTLGVADATTLNTGQGDYELYAMNQDVESTDAVTFATVNTGQGANELYDMNQNVLTTSDVTFGDATVDLIKLSSDSTNHQITDNSTCIIISGDTSDLVVC